MTKRFLITFVSAVICITALCGYASAATERDTRTVVRLVTDNPEFEPLNGLEIESIIGSMSHPCFSVRVTLGEKVLGEVRATPGSDLGERRIESQLLPEGAVTVPTADAGRKMLDTILQMVPDTGITEQIDKDYISSLFNEALAFDGRKLSRFEPLRLYDLSYIGEQPIDEFYTVITGMLSDAKETETPDKKAGFSTKGFNQTEGNDISFSADIDKTVSIALSADVTEKAILPLAKKVDWFFNLPESESFSGKLSEFTDKYPDEKLPMLVSLDKDGQIARILIGRSCPGASENITAAFSSMQKYENSGKTHYISFEYDSYPNSGEINRYIYVIRDNPEEPDQQDDSWSVMIVPSLGSAQVYYTNGETSDGVTLNRLDTHSVIDGKEAKGTISVTEKADNSFEILLAFNGAQPVRLIGTVEKGT